MSPAAGQLAGRTLVVSGAGPGLGRQVALAASRAGARVVLASRTPDLLEELAGEVRALGGEAATVVCDITRGEDCQRVAEVAEREFGSLDCLVANAFHPGAMTVRVEQADLDRWREVFEVNVLGTLRTVQAALPALRRSGNGAIVLINSQIVRRVKPGRGDYATSKAALLTAGQILATELGPDGIRVNSVVPGRMLGPPLQAYLQRQAEATGTSVQAQQAGLLQDMRLPYVATDGHVAETVVFLASDLAAGMTGQSVDVNAGETFH